LLRASRKKICPRGLSMISGSREPISKSLISACLARDVSQEPGKLNGLPVVTGGWGGFGDKAASSWLAIGERTAVTAPDKSTAAPRVIPVCPRINILL